MTLVRPSTLTSPRQAHREGLTLSLVRLGQQIHSLLHCDSTRLEPRGVPRGMWSNH
jgi:hypothetical protein